jgi:hypothetical protein
MHTMNVAGQDKEDRRSEQAKEGVAIDCPD